jgi:hypothetical protein
MRCGDATRSKDFFGVGDWLPTEMRSTLPQYTGQGVAEPKLRRLVLTPAPFEG